MKQFTMLGIKFKMWKGYYITTGNNDNFIENEYYDLAYDVFSNLPNAKKELRKYMKGYVSGC